MIRFLKRVIVSVTSLCFGLLFLSVHSLYAAGSYHITKFHSDITLQKNGTVLVKENIAVRFGDSLHGIYRDLPYVYRGQDGANTYTSIAVSEVEMDGVPEHYVLEKGSSTLRIKIGDPNQLISGDHTYRISYVATGVVRGFPTYDELYWNVTGNQWQVPIDMTSATLVLEAGQVVQSSCYSGSTGSTKACASQAGDPPLQFKVDTFLSAGEGMTIAVGYTKGAVPLLTVQPPPVLFSQHNLAVAGVWALLPIMIGSILLRIVWRRSHAGVPSATVIAPEYEAPYGLRPGELGVVLHEDATTLGVSASIVDLAVRGFITITEEPKTWAFGKADYLLARTNKKTDALLSYEQLLLDSVFVSEDSVRISVLKDSFSTRLASIKDQMYISSTKKQFFSENPQVVRNRYVRAGVVMIIVGALVLFINLPISSIPLIGFLVGFIITSVITVVAAYKMPTRTSLGLDAYRKALGYKLIISNTEKYRQPFLENQNMFMDVLPYAILFGVTKKLANAMQVMGTVPVQPNWYFGSSAFNPLLFGATMTSFSDSLSSVMASSPSGSGSGGSGYSGGGFGGGGGGGW